jgi:phenylacetic acid degradation operon negative regulatory protein
VAPTAKSFILDLLSTLRTGAMPVRALVAAAARFGIAENSIRVALARLLATHQVERDARGRYRLGAGAEPMNRHIASWRTLSQRMRAWSGAWVGVHTAEPHPAATGRAAEAGGRALRFLGFRSLEPGLDLRPDNLRGGVPAVREELRALGLDPHAVVFELRSLDRAREARARSLWNASLLRDTYRDLGSELARSSARLPRLSEGEAMVESFLLGGRVIRQLVIDPLLPEPIFPCAARDDLVEAMRHYDRLGRGCWARFLGRYQVPHLRAPADTGIAAGAARLAASGGAP